MHVQEWWCQGGNPMTHGIGGDRQGFERGRLVVECIDQPGIVGAVSAFLYAHGANIVHSDQFSADPNGGRFFLRVEFAAPGLIEGITDWREEFRPIAEQFALATRWTLASTKRRIAIFVSLEDHCLLELLWERQAGDLDAEIVAVISNHEKLSPIAKDWGVPYYHVPITAETKVIAEMRHNEILADHDVDVLVLARYMQIFSVDFVETWRGQMINIHHSFLPAFAGAKPFHQAFERGVKLIGATAHYVTADLDAGPIIEQDVGRVDHRDNPNDLRRISRQIERSVLARAVRWHCEDRVMIDGNKTVVFS